MQTSTLPVPSLFQVNTPKAIPWSMSMTLQNSVEPASCRQEGRLPRRKLAPVTRHHPPENSGPSQWKQDIGEEETDASLPTCSRKTLKVQRMLHVCQGDLPPRRNKGAIWDGRGLLKMLTPGVPREVDEGERHQKRDRQWEQQERLLDQAAPRQAPCCC